MIRLFVLVIVLFLAPPVPAEIYRWKNAEDNWVYSDEPQPGSEPVELRETTVVPSQRVARESERERDGQDSGPVPYEDLSISSPVDEQTIRDNVGNIAVTVSMQPSLQTDHGHRLQLLFDGEPVGKSGSATSFQLEQVNRGAHTLEAVVLDDNGNALARSPTSTFFLHQASRLIPRP